MVYLGGEVLVGLQAFVQMNPQYCISVHCEESSDQSKLWTREEYIFLKLFGEYGLGDITILFCLMVNRNSEADLKKTLKLLRVNRNSQNRMIIY